ncbi:WxL domain-containing protein [Brochothrix campestris]|uniref:Cell surface protein with WxL domain n=1 Tax=Brochothrix campestris FSL F6-1037 TaxID=1265861 RepID=W7CS84_9LIST|nr:WxL domain-containing protein [Brochothrix campestris]EUJ39540.1 cell surface protein with WxL domain [Brochothrix campestris FSL F6-1037]
MKMTFGKTLAIAALLVPATVTGVTTTHAAEGGSYNSNAVVNFITSTDPTLPVDPENPDPTNPIVPIDPTNPEGPGEGTAGPLSIDFASSLQFGTSKITTKDEIYSAYAQEIELTSGTEYRPNYVQVTDNRGTEAGWTLQVTQERQLTSTANKVLEGAVITLGSSTVSTVAGSTVTAPSNVPSAIVLTPGTPAVVFSAQAQEGSGVWLAKFGSSVGEKPTVMAGKDWKPGTEATETAEATLPTEFDVMRNSAVTLAVPGKAIKTQDQYSSSLIWSLSDVPTNSNED